jgi:hypothetical protein
VGVLNAGAAAVSTALPMPPAFSSPDDALASSFREEFDNSGICADALSEPGLGDEGVSRHGGFLATLKPGSSPP